MCGPMRHRCIHLMPACLRGTIEEEVRNEVEGMQRTRGGGGGGGGGGGSIKTRGRERRRRGGDEGARTQGIQGENDEESEGLAQRL